VSAIRKTSEMPEEVQGFLKTDPDCKWIQISAPCAPGSMPKTRQEFEALVTIARIAQDDSAESQAGLKWAFQRLLENYAGNELLGGLRMLCKFSKLEAKDLRAGKNVIAVEVHSHDPKKGALRFDLNLSTRPK
jgi:hypothetical protein